MLIMPNVDNGYKLLISILPFSILPQRLEEAGKCSMWQFERAWRTQPSERFLFPATFNRYLWSSKNICISTDGVS